MSSEHKANTERTGHFDPNSVLSDLKEKGYSFEERLGKSPLAYVYKLKSLDEEHPLAIKIYRRSFFDEDKTSLKRLELAARKAQTMHHPNISAVYEFGLSQKAFPYIVTDFLLGNNLKELLAQEGFLEVPQLLALADEILDALEYAHGEGCLHKGLKPSNIYPQKTMGKNELVKITNFGLGNILPNPGRQTIYQTNEGEEFGTPEYMSPEQCLGQPIDQRSDLYSLGCVIYEALCGKAPFTSSNPLKVAIKQMSESPKPLRQQKPELQIPSLLETIILTCLAKDPRERYQNAKVMRKELQILSSPEETAKREKLAKSWISKFISRKSGRNQNY
jgi:serine/threonine-protein kinase